MKNSTPSTEQGRGYAEKGYALGTKVISDECIAKVNGAMDRLLSGETKIPEGFQFANPDYDPKTDLCKLDRPHLISPEIHEAITSPLLGKAIAEITGAKRVQVWAAQMLNKPGGSNSSASVGWHQDYQYWQPFWTPESQLLTAWLAFSDVGEASGPLCFVPGSHRWGFLNAGGFFAEIGDENKDSVPLPEGEIWSEVPAIMGAGSFSLHDRLTYHGSYPNQSPTSRRSVAIHLCTENATATPGNSTGYDYACYLDDPAACPVIYDEVGRE